MSKGGGNQTVSYCFHPEVIHINSAHLSLAKVNHKATPTMGSKWLRSRNTWWKAPIAITVPIFGDSLSTESSGLAVNEEEVWKRDWGNWEEFVEKLDKGWPLGRAGRGGLWARHELPEGLERGRLTGGAARDTCGWGGEPVSCLRATTALSPCRSAERPWHP